jgi:4-diphosphocytidyl-2-C-methyl-D-erythritol kinase
LTQTSLKLPSFAKINWFLHVLGKRADGYHEVITVLQTISLADELIFHERADSEISLVCDEPSIPVDSSNLIVKAAHVLRQRTGATSGAQVQLKKRIPAKGGLGGASTNAAITLLALNELWKCGLGIDALVSLGSELGADVPFFLFGGCCAATGTGTSLKALSDVPKQHLITITPNAQVATAEAYRSLNAASLTTSDSASILSSSLAELTSADSRQWPLRNDFEKVIFEIEPEIECAKSALLDAGARGALLAGSGSSVFGLFENEAARNRACEDLKCEAGWRVFPCETLSRNEYFGSINPSGFPLLRSLKTADRDTGTGA